LESSPHSDQLVEAIGVTKVTIGDEVFLGVPPTVHAEVLGA
jgi:hypothetical protein